MLYAITDFESVQALIVVGLGILAAAALIGYFSGEAHKRSIEDKQDERAYNEAKQEAQYAENDSIRAHEAAKNGYFLSQRKNAQDIEG